MEIVGEQNRGYSQQTLAEVAEENLRGVGVLLDDYRYDGDQGHWREFALARFPEFYKRGEFATDELLLAIQRMGGSSGYALLSDLKSKGNVGVHRLATELRAVGRMDAVKFLLPPIGASISAHPTDVEARINSIAVFQVDVPEVVFPPPFFQWYQKKEEGWYPMENQNSNCLRFPVTCVEDGKFEFSCSVSNTINDSTYRASSNVAKILVVEALEVWTEPEYRLIKEGDSATFQCHVSGGPGTGDTVFSYEWFRSGRLLRGEGNSSLLVEKAGPEDEGSYSCRVSDFSHERAGNNSRPSRLALIFPPLVLEDLNKSSLRFGLGTAQTLCVRCRPMQGCVLVYTWLKDGQVTAADSNILRFTSVSESDVGKYTCQVSYREYPDMMTSSKSCVVRISGGAGDDGGGSTSAIDETISDTTVSAMPSAAASAVTVNGGVISTPRQEYGSSVSVQSTQSDEFHQMPLSHPTLSSDQATVALGKKLYQPYSRFAEIPDIMGRMPEVFQDMVIEDGELCSPVIYMQPPATVSVMCGSLLKIELSAYALPPAIYQWRFNGQRLAAPNRAYLIVENFSGRDEGTYTCYVYNEVNGRECGISSDEVIVSQADVHVATVLRQPEDQTIEHGASTELRFELDEKDPLIQFQWYRQRTITPADAGECLAQSTEMLADMRGSAIVIGNIFTDYMYWCEVTLPTGYVIKSHPAKVKVARPTSSDEVSELIDSADIPSGTSIVQRIARDALDIALPLTQPDSGDMQDSDSARSLSQPTRTQQETEIQFGETRGAFADGVSITDLVSLVTDETAHSLQPDQVSSARERKALFETPDVRPVSIDAKPQRKYSTAYQDYSKYSKEEQNDLRKIRHIVRHGFGTVKMALSDRPMSLCSCKIALLIANSLYENYPQLATPENDIVSIGKELEDLGFQVMTFHNLTLLCMDKLRNVLIKMLQSCPGCYMFFFYAGHGFEYKDQQFLIPIDAPLLSAEQGTESCNALIKKSVRFRRWRHHLSLTETQLHIAVLDCCRTLSVKNADLKLEDILEPQTENWIVLSSCLSGRSAKENSKSEHSLFAQKFLRELDGHKGVDQEGKVRTMKAVLSFFNTVLSATERGSSQGFELKRSLCRGDMSLADPVLETKGTQIVREMVSKMHCTFEKSKSRSNDPKITVHFMRYMTNCVLAYCRGNSSVASDYSVQFDPLRSKMAGATCSTKVTSHQREWLKAQITEFAIRRSLLGSTGKAGSSSSGGGGETSWEPAIMIITDLHLFAEKHDVKDAEECSAEVVCSLNDASTNTSVSHCIPVNCHGNMLFKECGADGMACRRIQKLIDKTEGWEYGVSVERGQAQGQGLGSSTRPRRNLAISLRL